MRLFFLSLCLAILSFSAVHAQTTDTPIIALHEGNIYAVNPSDGSSTVLVPAPRQYAEIDEVRYEPVTLTSEEWLSPDGLYLAYRVIYPANPSETITENSSFTQALFILDLANPSRPISIGLGADENVVESVAWSLDNLYLYVLANNQLHIIERENWAVSASVEVGNRNFSQAPVIGRHIFATENSVVLADTGEGSLAIEFAVFNNQAEKLHQFIVDWNLSPDVNLYINTLFTPLTVEGQVTYPFVHMYGGYLLYQTDFNTGETVEADFAYPALLSRSAIEESLHVFSVSNDGDMTILLIFDHEDNYLGETEYLATYSYGIMGDNIGTTFALAPDGQRLAYLSGGRGGILTLWEDGETRSLDFTADTIVWASPIYMPFSPDYFRG